MQLPSMFEAVQAVLFYTLLSAGGGLAAFHLLCLNPVLQSVGEAGPSSVTRRLWRWTAVSSTAAALTVTLHVVWLYQDKADGASLPGWFFSGRNGLVALTELALAVVLVVSAVRKASTRRYAAIAIATPLVFLADNYPPSFDTEITRLIISRLSHAGHLIGMVVWLGGIVGVILLGYELVRSASPARVLTRSDVWLRVMKRFTIAAMTSAFLVLFSGYWFYWAKVGGFDSVNHELLRTPYGRVVALKIVLTLLLCACGGVNEFVIIPRIARGVSAVGALFRVVCVEIVAMVAVVACAPFLLGGAREQYYELIHPDATKAQLKAAGTGPIDTEFWIFFLSLTALTAAFLVAAGLASVRIVRRLQNLDQGSRAPEKEDVGLVRQGA